jgi:hypothetical protein
MIAISHAVKLLKYAADAPSFENFCVRHCGIDQDGGKQLEEDEFLQNTEEALFS